MRDGSGNDKAIARLRSTDRVNRRDQPHFTGSVCATPPGPGDASEIRDGQVHRILAGGTGPCDHEAAVTLPGQHEDALAAGNHEVEPPVAGQIASPGGGSSPVREGIPM